MAGLLSVNVGLPRDVTWNGKTVRRSVEISSYGTANGAQAAAWDPKFASLLELAEACDVPVRWSCRSGVCHTCVTGLIGGSITYNPKPLERPAPGGVLVCCFQPNSGVTLDL